MEESAGAEKKQIEESKEAQEKSLSKEKKQIEQSAKQAEKELSAQTKAEKQKIESQAEAEKAQIEAQKKQVEAQAKAAKADVKAQEIANEPAGAGTATTLGKPGGLTALDQGTSEADLKITKEIRQSLTSATAPTDLSLAAKNVAIITKDGVITLKGIVKTEAEKQSLETKAAAIPGVKSINNQLEVKSQ